MAKDFFSNVSKLSSLEGDPPTVSVFEDGELVGYLFVTRAITSSKGYSSQEFDMLVGLGLDGKLTGAKVLKHNEPIIGMYTPEGELILPKFTAQYKGLDIRVPTKVNLLRTEGEGSIDGISSATVSAVLFNGAILRAARIVALSKGIRLNDSPVVDIVNFKETPFSQLISDGSIARLTLTMEELKKNGITKPLVSNRSGVADIYRYKAIFAGNTPVAAKQKEVKKGYKDTERELALDLFLAPVVTPTIGRNLLGDKWYDIFIAGRDPNETTIVIAALGRYPLDGETHIADGNFKRLSVIQDERYIPLLKNNFRNLGFLHGEDKPYFAEAGLYRIPADAGLNPVKPWKLEILIESKNINENKKYILDYKLDDKYIIQPDGLIKIANKDTPIWHAAWENQKNNISILIVTLIILTIAIIRMDVLSKFDYRRKIFRYLFLSWILVWLGWIAGGQITILSVLMWIAAPINNPSWNVLLSDPLLTVLMVYVISTFIFWGRGLFCGWLCPFGSFQEILAKLAQYFNLPQIKVSEKVNRNSLNIKYVVLLLLIISSFYSADILNLSSEVEPFKTTISMKFQREWYFVLYAVSLLTLGLFIERFFCRFLCPLGAFMVLGGKLRLKNPLKRRLECGNPCKLCSKACPIDAIDQKGNINMNECFYCLDCQSLYYNNYKCPPLVIVRKKSLAVQSKNSKLQESIV
ncbi:MAG: 4Fe-4S binding protein [Alphaproteobacteria bacterium TMED93]|nr:MAG: 4Fe-4S binding protein [Alphaproteobacteria bacterium TMED93]